jgi:hypothetical protein
MQAAVASGLAAPLPRIAHFEQDSLRVRNSLPGRESFHLPSAILFGCCSAALRLCV